MRTRCSKYNAITGQKPQESVQTGDPWICRSAGHSYPSTVTIARALCVLSLPATFPRQEEDQVGLRDDVEPILLSHQHRRNLPMHPLRDFVQRRVVGNHREWLLHVLDDGLASRCRI